MPEHTAPAKIDHDRRAQVGNKEQQRENAAIDKARAHAYLIRLRVDARKLVIHILFLPEVLRHCNPAHHLMYTIENHCLYITLNHKAI